jgi:hypothetical protein
LSFPHGGEWEGGGGFGLALFPTLQDHLSAEDADFLALGWGDRKSPSIANPIDLNVWLRGAVFRGFYPQGIPRHVVLSLLEGEGLGGDRVVKELS